MKIVEQLARDHYVLNLLNLLQRLRQLVAVNQTMNPVYAQVNVGVAANANLGHAMLERVNVLI